MPLKPVKTKDATDSNPMSMCEYLGHFKQRKYMNRGHNDNGSAFNDAPAAVDNPTLPSVQGLSSNLFRSGGDRVDTPENYYQAPSMVDQLLDQRPAPTVDTGGPSEVRDPPRGTVLHPLFNSNGHANLSSFLGDALKPIVKVI
jgi:hypothetical protein